MDLLHSIDTTKLKREKSKDAIQLALEGRWREAITVNQEILYHFQDDVEALNRLGKACLEIGEYTRAKDSFQNVLRLSPHNTIAKRNLSRLSHLSIDTTLSQEGKKVTPQLFLEESGKSKRTALTKLASQKVLAKVAAGDLVALDMYNNTLIVNGLDGDVLGFVEPKLGSRLVRLMKQGNTYRAAVLSAGPDRISVIIRETFRHPNVLGVSSFPTTGGDEYRGYVRDSHLRYDIDSDPEEEAEEDPIPMWNDDGEEASSSLPRRPVRNMTDNDDDSDDD